MDKSQFQKQLLQKAIPITPLLKGKAKDNKIHFSFVMMYGLLNVLPHPSFS
jgi:hypothetical protein